MSPRIEITGSETGILRLFALSMSAEEARALEAPGALAEALGVGSVDATRGEVVALDDLAPLGLATYLTEGVGARADDVRAVRSRLDALDGHVLLLRGGAVAAEAEALTPDPRLILIATLHEDRPPPPPMTPLRSDSARGTLSGPPEADAEKKPRRNTRTILLIVVALLALLLLIWVLL